MNYGVCHIYSQSGFKFVVYYLKVTRMYLICVFAYHLHCLCTAV